MLWCEPLLRWSWRRHQEVPYSPTKNSPRTCDISILKSITSLNRTACCAGLIKCAALPLTGWALAARECRRFTVWHHLSVVPEITRQRLRSYWWNPKRELITTWRRARKKKEQNCFINSVYENGWREKRRLSAALNESRLAKQLGMIKLRGAVYYCVMMCCPVNWIVGKGRGDLMRDEKNPQTFLVDSLHSIRGVERVKIAHGAWLLFV